MIMRRLVSVSAEVSGLGNLMRANTSGSIYWGSGLGDGNIDDAMSSNRLGQADQHICSYLLLNIWVCLHQGLLDDVYSGESLSDEILLYDGVFCDCLARAYLDGEIFCSS